MTPEQRERRIESTLLVATIGVVVGYIGRQLGWALGFSEAALLGGIGAAVLGALWLSDRLASREDREWWEREHEGRR